MTVANIIAQNIRRYRTSLGYSRQDMALAMGISADALDSLEQGDASLTVENLEAIAAYLGIPAAALLEPDEPEELPPHADCEKPDRFFYQMERQFCDEPVLGEYRSWGLKVYVHTAGQWLFVDALRDVSTDFTAVRHMADAFNRHQLYPIHLRDAVEDMLAEPLAMV
jgi:transcriptional regulator with XRE-family HTH domain